MVSVLRRGRLLHYKKKISLNLPVLRSSSRAEYDPFCTVGAGAIVRVLPRAPAGLPCNC
jgi:hypothetical protein